MARLRLSWLIASACLMASACSRDLVPVAPPLAGAGARPLELQAADGDCSDYGMTWNDFDRKRDLYALVSKYSNGTARGTGSYRSGRRSARLTITHFVSDSGCTTAAEILAGYAESATFGGTALFSNGQVKAFTLELISHHWPSTSALDEARIRFATDSPEGFRGELHHEGNPLY